jgi:norsolorinic acid ketoreductase
MASDANVILITGANRGIGLGFTRSYLMMEGATVIAAVRDPSSVSSKALAQLPRGRGSSLVILKIDACSSVDALEAAKTIRHMSIKHIDIAIANAAVGYIYPTVKDLQVADLQAHMEPNVYGNVRLYQAILPLLLAAAEPKWVTIGSLGGSIGVSLAR